MEAEARNGPTSAPLSDEKQADFSLLIQIGRALKHEATKILHRAVHTRTTEYDPVIESDIDEFAYPRNDQSRRRQGLRVQQIPQCR
jgi:hypothetical protein